MSRTIDHQLFNWHLEISSKCLLKCPRCIRQESPNSFTKTETSLEFIKKVFPPLFLKKNIHRITFGGGVGDAIYNSQFIEIVKYLKTNHPQIQLVLVTNGSHRSKSWWTNLSEYLNINDEIIFSIDGWDNASNNLYRVNSDWNSIINAIKIIVESPAIVRWQTIIFKFNQDNLEMIKNIAKGCGVDQFYLIKSSLFGSLNPAYNNPTTGIDNLEPAKKFVSDFTRTQRMKTKFNPHSEKMKNYKNFFKQFNAVSLKQEKIIRNKYSNHYIMPTCLFAYRGSYIDWQGIYYPCSWVSHPFKTIRSKENSSKILLFENFFFEKNREKFNLNKRSLEDVLSDPVWRDLDKSWHSKETMSLVCEKKCRNEITSNNQLKPGSMIL